MTTPGEAATKVPREGDPAPKFKLPAFPSGSLGLEDYLGKKNVILAFYPKDDTPGCTREMCSFSDDLSKFESSDTVVLGISYDSVESHEKFSGKYNLKQHLLADKDGHVATLYGAAREGKNSANRILFVIDKKGIIHHVIDGMPDNQKLLEMVSKI